MRKYKLLSLFSGAGGLDLGFENAGFDVVWANENNKAIWATYEWNHKKTKLCKDSIIDIDVDKLKREIGNVDGIIGGPPCQSWSLAGNMNGIEDDRGKLVNNYIKFIKIFKPKFFLFENVPGIISSKHRKVFDDFVEQFKKLGYSLNYKLLDSSEYGIPQQRKRVIVIGYKDEYKKVFDFNKIKKVKNAVTLKEAIADLEKVVVPALDKNYSNPNVKVSNHEYALGSFSTIYMSRNRKKGWDEPSFTIQAGGRHAPLHPSANAMIYREKNRWEFDKQSSYRRLSVRECARIQTFPDTFEFKYKNVMDGYLMIGNAVPVKLANIIAREIKKDLEVMDEEK